MPSAQVFSKQSCQFDAKYAECKAVESSRTYVMVENCLCPYNHTWRHKVSMQTWDHHNRQGRRATKLEGANKMGHGRDLTKSILRVYQCFASCSSLREAGLSKEIYFPCLWWMTMAVFKIKPRFQELCKNKQLIHLMKKNNFHFIGRKESWLNGLQLKVVFIKLQSLRTPVLSIERAEIYNQVWYEVLQKWRLILTSIAIKGQPLSGDQEFNNGYWASCNLRNCWLGCYCLASFSEPSGHWNGPASPVQWPLVQESYSLPILNYRLLAWHIEWETARLPHLMWPMYLLETWWWELTD